jgi:hypothetical protein
MKKIILSMLVIMTTLSGCTQRLIDFTVISSKNVSLKIDKAQGKNTVGKSMGVFNLGVSIKDAMDKALQNAGADYDLLVDGVVRYASYPFYGGYIVEGVAVSTSKMKASLGQKGFEEWCKQHQVFDATKQEVKY